MISFDFAASVPTHFLFLKLANPRDAGKMSWLSRYAVIPLDIPGVTALMEHAERSTYTVIDGTDAEGKPTAPVVKPTNYTHTITLQFNARVDFIATVLRPAIKKLYENPGAVSITLVSSWAYAEGLYFAGHSEAQQPGTTARVLTLNFAERIAPPAAKKETEPLVVTRTIGRDLGG